MPPRIGRSGPVRPQTDRAKASRSGSASGRRPLAERTAARVPAGVLASLVDAGLGFPRTRQRPADPSRTPVAPHVRAGPAGVGGQARLDVGREPEVVPSVAEPPLEMEQV